MPTDAGGLDLDRMPPEYRAVFEAQIAALSEEKHTLAERNTELATRNARLEHRNHDFRQALYGKASERLDPDARQIASEDPEVAIAAADEAAADTALSASVPRHVPAWAACRQSSRAWRR